MTGAFWDVTDPLKPFGLFDPNGVYDIPFDWAEWLAGLVDTYASHVITCDPALECTTSAEDEGVVVARFSATGTPALVANQKYFIRCHIVTTGGQEEEQTLYLKVREK